MFDFGGRIQQLRVSHNMSQEELGIRLNRSKSVICGYENNVRVPPLDVLVNIAVIFNVSLDYLVGIDKNEMVSISGLNGVQKKLVHSLISELQSKSTSCLGLTNSQQEIINQIMVEFSLKHR